MPTTPTLDHDRTAQFRTFLTVEVAAELAADAPVANRHPHRGRRILVGTVAAVALGGAVFAANEVTGGPGGTTRVEPAAALAIETADGWTTIHIADIDADPDQVVAELRAAGFSATRERLEGVDLQSPGAPGDLVPAGTKTALSLDPADRRLSVVGAAPRETGGRGLAGISVHTPDQLPALVFEGPAGAETGRLDLEGVRISTDGSVSVRAGTDVELVVLSTR